MIQQGQAEGGGMGFPARAREATAWKGRATAFTLIEVLFVVIIIGLIAALVVGRLGKTFSRGQVETMKAQVKALGNAVEEFRADVGRYPTEQEGLKALVERPREVDEKAWGGPYLEKKTVPLDAWRHEFIYKHDEKFGFVIRSLGADGKEGGEGDDADIDNRS